MMTDGEKKLVVGLSVRRTGNGASTRRSTIFQPITSCGCNGDTKGRKKRWVERKRKRRMTIDRSCRFYVANTRRQTPNTWNGRAISTRATKKKKNVRATGTADGRGMNGRQSVSRITTRDDAANTATRRMHARASVVTKNHRRRVPAGVRAPVVLLLWFPPTRPPADGQQTRRRRNNIIVPDGRARHVRQHVIYGPVERRPMFFGPYTSWLLRDRGSILHFILYF